MKKISNILLIICGILLLGVLHICYPVCDKLLELTNGNMIHMKCFYTSQVATMLAILLIIDGIVSVITKKSNVVLTMSIGIMIVLTTYTSYIGIGICANKAMACQTTALWLRIFGTATILLSICQYFLKQKRES